MHDHIPHFESKNKLSKVNEALTIRDPFVVFLMSGALEDFLKSDLYVDFIESNKDEKAFLDKCQALKDQFKL